MTLFIMHQHQGTTAQDLAGATDESAWNELLCVHGEAQAVDIETGRSVSRWFLVGLRLEDAGCPFPKGMGEGLSSSCTGKLGKKSLDVSISVGTCFRKVEHIQSIPTVSAQIPGATQSDGAKEEQREQEHATRGVPSAAECKSHTKPGQPAIGGK
jgi:hypothetical protein